MRSDFADALGMTSFVHAPRRTQAVCAFSSRPLLERIVVNKWILRPTICVVLVLLLCREAWTQQPDNRDPVVKIMTLIDMIPSWPLLGWNTSREERELLFRNARLIEECACRISQFSSDEIREAIIRYEESIKQRQRPDDRRESLFFLNKYLFDLPELVERDSPHFRIINTGWLGMPIANDPNSNQPSDTALAR